MSTDRKHHPYSRRAAAAPMFVVTTPLIFGFMALSIDVGRLYVVRAELQNAADAGAMAGASVYGTDAGLRQDLFELTDAINHRAQEVAQLNRTLRAPTLLESEDIKFGAYDFQSGQIDFNVARADRLNVVQVTARRTAGGPNGPVPYYFARIFGLNTGNVSATGAALAEDRFAGLRVVESPPVTLVPFTIHEDLYDEMAANGPDEFSYDYGVLPGVDGIPEVNVYPHRIKQTGGNSSPEDPASELEGAGNFGLLNIGVPNVGVPEFRYQVTNGISPAQMEAEIGTSDLMYYDQEGNPITHMITGTPGVAAGLESTIEARIGHTVAFFVHRNVSYGGSNAVFETVGIRTGRIMTVELRGSPQNKRLVIQPVANMDSNIIVTETAPSTDGQMGRIMLLR